MNRIDRLTAILIQLQSKRLIRASDIADRFEISQRTVYRDIKALEEAGVPIGAEAGKGYYILEGYHLPPVMFSKEEGSALLIGEKFMEKLSDKSLLKEYKSSLDKIRAVMRSAEKEHLESLDKSVYISHYSPFTHDEPVSDALVHLQNALCDNKVVMLDYHAAHSEEHTQCRKVEPVALSYYSLHWHFIGYCQLRKDYRDFRIDRIEKITILDEKVNPENRKDMTDYINNFMESSEIMPVKILFPLTLKKTIAIQKYYHGWISEEEKPNGIVMNFLSSSLDYMANWIISLAEDIDILEPPELQTILEQRIQKLAQLFLKVKQHS